jgi:hypothetical protein
MSGEMQRRAEEAEDNAEERLEIFAKTARDIPDYCRLPLLECAQHMHALRAELRNIANAQRFNREYFDDDTAFAEWAQSRARHVLKPNV